MIRDLISGRFARAIAMLGIGVIATLSVTAARRSASPAAASFQTPLGSALPDVQLQTPDGHLVSLRERLHGKPALIYVFSAQECASCSNLPLEFKIVHNEVPGLQTMLIGSGSAAAAFAPLIHDMGLEQSALIDERRQLLGAFDLAHEPLVILADSAGQIMLADTRNASRAAQFPMGHLLRGIKAIVGGAGQ